MALIYRVWLDVRFIRNKMSLVNKIKLGAG